MGFGEWFTENVKEFILKDIFGMSGVLIAALVLIAVGGVLLFLKKKLERQGGVPVTYIAAGLCFAGAAALILWGGQEGLSLILTNWYYPVVAILMIAVVASLFVGGRQRWDGRLLAYAALCLAIGFVLSSIRLYRMPAGGSVVLCAVLPLVAFSVYCGVWRGAVLCVAYGLLQVLRGAWIIHPLQGALDYLVAYTVLSLGGLVRLTKIPDRWKLPAALLLTGILRWGVHILSGIAFFADDAPPEQGPLLYSAIYNLFLFPEVVLSMIIAALPGFARLFAPLESLSAARG